MQAINTIRNSIRIQSTQAANGNSSSTSSTQASGNASFNMSHLMEASQNMARGWERFVDREYTALNRAGSPGSSQSQTLDAQGTSADEIFEATTGSGHDRLTTHGGDGNNLIVQNAGTGRNHLISTSGSGDDIVLQRDEGDGTFRQLDGRMKADTGAGNDRIRQWGSGGVTEANGGTGDDNLQVRAGDRFTVMFQNGEDGHDVLAAYGGRTPDSQGSDSARQDGGAGNDYLYAYGQERKMNVGQHGDDGDDQLWIEGSRDGSYVSQSGGKGFDSLSYLGRGDNDNIVQHGDEGQDLVEAHLHGSENRIVQTGGDGDDFLRVQGDQHNFIRNPGDEELGTDVIGILGEDGNDQITVDGGVDYNRIRVFGGDGNDSINYKVRVGDNTNLNGGNGHDRAVIDASDGSYFNLVDDKGKTLYEHVGTDTSGEVAQVRIQDLESVRVTDRSGETLFSQNKRHTRRSSRFD